MMKLLPTILMTIVTVTCAGADSFDVAFGALDPVAAGIDPEVVSLVMPRVVSVENGSPAKAMGLKVGDLLVGLDGLNVIGKAEWDLVRYRRPVTPTGIRMAVLRDYRVIELRSETILPGRRVGFVFAEEHEVRVMALARIGFRVPGDPDLALTFPPRAALALLRWNTHRGVDESSAWIGDLAGLFAAVTNQQWSAAAALPAIIVPASCPHIVKLERFYRALAAYHADGERDPDPNHLGENLAWLTIHYPYPRVLLPELGAFTHPDAALAVALEELRRHPGRVSVGASSVKRLEMPEGETSYSHSVKMGVLHPEAHGGWWFRHVDIRDAKKRKTVLAALTTLASGDDPLADWSQFALISGTLFEALEKQRDEPHAEVLPKIAALRQRSPLLGYLALDVMKSGLSVWGFEGLRETLRKAFNAGPLPSPEKPSRFLQHLRAHEASLAFDSLPRDGLPLCSQLPLIHAALSRPIAFADLQRRLASERIAELPFVERLALMEQMRDYVQICCQAEDLRLMGRLDLAGALTAALGDVARGQVRSGKDCSWLRGATDTNFGSAPEQQAVPHMRQLMEMVPWTDHSAAEAAIRNAYLIAGTPMAALHLAEVCDAKGFAVAAADIRTRVFGLYDGLDELMAQGQFNRRFQLYLMEISLRTCAFFPATAKRALEVSERMAAIEKKGEDWDSISLYRAHAAMTTGQAEAASDWLCRSFMAAKQDDTPLFFVYGEVVNDCRSYRTHLLQALLALPGLTEPMRKRIIAAARHDLVDDRFATLLGVTRASLTGQGTATGANDF